MLEEFKELIARHPQLVRDIDNIREDSHGNIIYTYDGFIDCAIINDGAEFGDWGDTCQLEIDAYLDGIYDARNIRWFPTLEELVETMAEEVNPELMA